VVIVTWLLVFFIRRDLLLSGSSLVAASALAASGPGPTRRRRNSNIDSVRVADVLVGASCHRLVRLDRRRGTGAGGRSIALLEQRRGKEMDLFRAGCDPGGADFVPSEQRTATFDNCGPHSQLYFQIMFVIDRVKALAVTARVAGSNEGQTLGVPAKESARAFRCRSDEGR
jgi:hypothetical protein